MDYALAKLSDKDLNILFICFIQKMYEFWNPIVVEILKIKIPTGRL